MKSIKNSSPLLLMNLTKALPMLVTLVSLVEVLYFNALDNLYV